MPVCTGAGKRAAIIMVAAGLAAPFLHGQESSWYEKKAQAGSNFYDIVKEHQARMAAKKSALTDDLTALLLKDPELYELEKDFQFKRWMEYAEPRVSPSGDMSLLDRGQEEIASLVMNAQSRLDIRGEWEPTGPFSLNTNGAGRINWLEFHPTNDSAMMVGSPGGGVWFSKDAGKTWTTTTDGIAILGAAWAVYHPVNPDIIYLGTGDGFHSDTKSIGVLKSVDGGKTWNSTGLVYPVSGSTQIMKLSVDARNPERLIVATTSGVQVSNDGGTTFIKATGITSKVWDLEISPGNGNTVYASTSVLYRSTDGGKTFTAVSGAPTSTFRMLLAVTPDEPSWVYLLRGGRSATEGVSLSTDNGITFVGKGAASEVGCSQAWYDYAFAANPTNAADLAAGCLRVYRSSNQGVNWTQHGSSYHVDIQGLYFRKDGTLFVTSDGGIWRNTGTTATAWVNLNNNLNIGQSYRLGVYRYDYDRICTGRQDNGTDFKDGGEFKRALGGDGFECFWNTTGTRFFGESQNGAFSRCTYANGALSGCTGVAPSEGGTWNTPWTNDPKDANTLYAGRASNIWKSTDNGTAWTQLGTVGGSGSIRNFNVAASNTAFIYVLKGSDVLKTANNGQTWTNIRGTMTGTPLSAAVSEKDANDIWVAVSGYTATAKVWHSINGGQSWTNETYTGLPNLPANAVAVDDAAGGVYVGMDVGVYYKKKGTNVWLGFTGGLPNASIRELEIAQKGTNASDRRLLAATYGRGVWRSKLWDETVPVAVGSRAPTLRRFSSSVSGKTLKVRFQVGTDRDSEGLTTLQLNAADGTVLHREQVPGFGLFEREISLARAGKGVFYFVLKGPGGQVSRRIAVY